MPYGTPTRDTQFNGTYQIQLTHTNSIHIHVEVSSANQDAGATEAQADAAVQALVDALDGSADFTFDAVNKVWPYYEAITPTP